MSDESKPSSSNSEPNNHDAESFTLREIVEEDDRLKANAAAVLGASDDKNCTYEKGYIPRQALYSCSTCSASSNEIAGVCLACSYECHEGHDLYELYTKRFFRCDCGNDKFPNSECKFNKFKDSTNNKNKYNQNFKGLYCSCHKPYPDPEDEIEDEMIQCSMCEDWLHGRHLGCKVEPDYEEMICTGCVSKYEFISAYSTQTTVIKTVNGDTQVDVVKTDQQSSSSTGSATGDPGSATSSKKRRSSGELKKTDCLLKRLLERETTTVDHACFMSEGWRTRLCRCTSCKTMYADKGVSFILDEDDTVQAYEDKGLASHSFTDSNALPQALSQMDRVQQVELIHGFNDMKEGLMEYLKQFAESGKVVTEADIKDFFSQMHSRKRQKTENGFQYSCK